MTSFSISPTHLNASLTTPASAPMRPRVFDVRKRPAFDVDPQLIPSATWQIHDQVGAWANEIPEHINVVVYCVHGHEVSQNAAKHLRDLGIDARYLKGGIDEWKKAGFDLIDANSKGGK